MNALLESKPTTRPDSLAAKSRSRRQYDRVQHQNHQTAQVIESAIMILINCCLLGMTAYTLVHLIPHQISQSAKLREIKIEKEKTAAHVAQLKQEYQRSLQPEEALRIAEEQGHVISNKKQRIFLLSQP
ncbi:hypothetical protein GS597_12360 [Synechococcales cyanobacterium C]|uniref:Uncharacterized protein n=1 Tax=Petrachloros mirabilis ULC683 TaxID=2781853 RepID=A0A8K2A8K2_9CYAN|nr:hypothetical protein [Petrachloros mirabilis]NCJ07284.1 hypothetical protein [Petrachloros mirabilis ULC683]